MTFAVVVGALLLYRVVDALRPRARRAAVPAPRAAAPTTPAA
jgi:hypothetical protein